MTDDEKKRERFFSEAAIVREELKETIQETKKFIEKRSKE